MVRWAAWLLAAVVLVAGAGCASAPAGPTTVRVAAASDLKFALDEVVEAFAETNPGVQVEVSYGSSGSLFQQLANGAPFDLYLSADIAYPEQLVAQGLATEEDLFAYAVGRLVVWAAHGSPADPADGIEVVTDPAVRRVAIANPAHAPYGQAAVAALRTAGVYEEAEAKLVLGDNIAQAAEFAASGNAEVGIIALSLALAPPMRDAGGHQEVPLASFPRLDQGGVVVGGSPPARLLRDHLISQAGRDVLARYGFLPPEG